MSPIISLFVLSLPFLETARAAVKTMSNDTLAKVLTNAKSGSTMSWENGTLARAISEFSVPTISPFSTNAIPPPSTSSDDLSTLAEAAIAHKLASFGASSLNSLTAVSGNNLSLLDDGAAGDPASLGELVVWANYTGIPGGDYAVAAQQEILYITTVAPRTSDGAISHRSSQVQLWSDSTYMVPPFMAYWAVLTSNQTLMTDAVNQARLYRQYLKTDSGLWKHIQLGSGTSDAGTWGTGNGWAAAGMVRVLAILKNSAMASSFSSDITDLQTYVGEILGGAFKNQLSTGLLRDYPELSTSFADASCSALLASVAYRLSALGYSSVWIPYAEKVYSNISSQLTASTDGWLAPVVDPLSWGTQGSQSPEGQSFVILMESARRQWVSTGSKNATGKTSAGLRTTVIYPPILGAGALSLAYALVW